MQDLIFQAELTYEDGIIVGTIDGFDLVVEGKSEQETIWKLTESLLPPLFLFWLPSVNFCTPK
ncbi:MAG: hypothetical protein PHR04_06190 [Syntrophomonadaceae bacterium]|nr:hypothetical protein [Syntrophomonadaceae bacterium]